MSASLTDDRSPTNPRAVLRGTRGSPIGLKDPHSHEGRGAD